MDHSKGMSQCCHGLLWCRLQGSNVFLKKDVVVGCCNIVGVASRVLEGSVQKSHFALSAPRSKHSEKHERKCFSAFLENFQELVENFREFWRSFKFREVRWSSVKLSHFDVSRSDLCGSTPRWLVPTHLLQVWNLFCWAWIQWIKLNQQRNIKKLAMIRNGVLGIDMEIMLIFNQNQTLNQTKIRPWPISETHRWSNWNVEGPAVGRWHPWPPKGPWHPCLGVWVACARCSGMRGGEMRWDEVRWWDEVKCGGFRFRSSSLLTDLISRLDGSDGSDGWDGWCSFSCTSCGRRWKENSQGTYSFSVLSKRGLSWPRWPQDEFMDA